MWQPFQVQVGSYIYSVWSTQTNTSGALWSAQISSRRSVRSVNCVVLGDAYLDWRVRIVFLWSERLPEDGRPVPKHVVLILVMNCILLGALVGWCINFKNMHGIRNINLKPTILYNNTGRLGATWGTMPSTFRHRKLHTIAPISYCSLYCNRMHLQAYSICVRCEKLWWKFNADA